MRLGLLPLIAIAMAFSNVSAQRVLADAILIDTCLGGPSRIPLEHPGKREDSECAPACHAPGNRRTQMANRPG